MSKNRIRHSINPFLNPAAAHVLLASALCAVHSQSAANREPRYKMRAANPLIAVCVCTRARPNMLRRCLASLRAQRFDAAHFRMKLILVDNTPEPIAETIY